MSKAQSYWAFIAAIAAAFFLLPNGSASAGVTPARNPRGRDVDVRGVKFSADVLDRRAEESSAAQINPSSRAAQAGRAAQRTSTRGNNATGAGGGKGGGLGAIADGILGFTAGIVGEAFGILGFSPNDALPDKLNAGIAAGNHIGFFSGLVTNPMAALDAAISMFSGKSNAPDKADAPSPANNFRGAGGASGGAGDGGTGDGGPGHGEGAGTGGNR